jgi:3-dehydroquinate synthase
MTATVTVAGERDYDVVVGHGVLARVASLLGDDAERVAVLHAPTVDRWSTRVVDALAESGREVVPIRLPDAESAKTTQVLDECWARLGDAGFTRSDAVVTVGGGATTDVGGFVAASWLRGVDVVHVPTTTLAMVDAAVGGKTGINTAAGKNLVGAFHAPRGVVVDLDVLADLPVDEHRAGLAEVVKAGFIADTRILELMQDAPAEILSPGSEVLADVVTRAIEVKARVVSADLRETAGAPLSREILNYGHTFGHAIEKVEQYRWRHGHAVSVGMAFVAEVAALEGRLNDDAVDLHRRVLTSLGLPVAYRGDRWQGLLDAMRIDKKARGRTLRLVLLEGIGAPVVVPAPGDEVLHEAYRRVSA